VEFNEGFANMNFSNPYKIELVIVLFQIMNAALWVHLLSIIIMKWINMLFHKINHKIIEFLVWGWVDNYYKSSY
jgi:hypothetical protein